MIQNCGFFIVKFYGVCQRLLPVACPTTAFLFIHPRIQPQQDHIGRTTNCRSSYLYYRFLAAIALASTARWTNLTEALKSGVLVLGTKISSSVAVPKTALDTASIVVQGDG